MNRVWGRWMTIELLAMLIGRLFSQGNRSKGGRNFKKVCGDYLRRARKDFLSPIWSSLICVFALGVIFLGSASDRRWNLAVDVPSAALKDDIVIFLQTILFGEWHARHRSRQCWNGFNLQTRLGRTKENPSLKTMGYGVTFLSTTSLINSPHHFKKIRISAVALIKMVLLTVIDDLY